MIQPEQAPVWGTVGDPTSVGTLRDTGCCRGSQVGGQGHAVSGTDTACSPR